MNRSGWEGTGGGTNRVAPGQSLVRHCTPDHNISHCILPNYFQELNEASIIHRDTDLLAWSTVHIFCCRVNNRWIHIDTILSGAQASIWLLEFMLTALLVFVVFCATDTVRETFWLYLFLDTFFVMRCLVPIATTRYHTLSIWNQSAS